MTVTETTSEEQTIRLAADLAETLKPGSFIAVNGDLGAGKTAFAKGIARGLGVTETVVSPTFTFLRAYDTGRLPLYHFDVYRVGGTEELRDIDFYEYARGDGVCVCEWAELVADELPERYVEVRIERMGDSKRRITIKETSR